MTGAPTQTVERKDAWRADFFVLRTPLLPFDDFLNVAASATPELARERLRAALSRAEVREAIFVASPDLAASLAAWLEEPGGDRGRRAEEALVRYLARMCGRPTPFGLFAGCSLGRIGDVTRLVIEGREAARRHTRLDTDLVAALAFAMGRDLELRPHLRFYPNSSLTRAAGRLRYVEGVESDGGRCHRLVAVDPTEHLDLVLARAERGELLATLASALVEAWSDLEPADAEAYVGELADAQILVSELEPAVTGLEPGEALTARLASIPEAAAAWRALDEAERLLERLDSGGLGAGPETYGRLAKALETLPVKAKPSRLVQVDLSKFSPAATIGGDVLEEIQGALRLLHRIAVPAPDRLASFRDAFLARHEERQVPLLEALDEESGIGFEPSRHPSADSSPLLAGLWMQQDHGAGAAAEVGNDRREQVLLGLLDRALRRGDDEVALATDELERLEAAALELGEPLPLPGALAVVASLGAPSPEDLAASRFRLLVKHVHGPSGAVLLGRFCHGDPELTRAVERHLRSEEALDPEAVFAEVAHLPEGRLGNILLRPVLRRHEIPYLAASGVPLEDRIPVQDLLVSVVGREVVLRSARLGRRVIPRLTSAHNFARRSVGVYRFLCVLQGQGVQDQLGWSWGSLKAAPFLPRVVAGRTVLARATWLLEGAELERIRKRPIAERLQALGVLRTQRRLPRFVLLADGDNELPVDLESPLSVAGFLGSTRDAGPHRLVELWPPPDEFVVSGPEGRFVHELVVPLVRIGLGAAFETRVPTAAQNAAGPHATRQSVPRRFPPGSEWLYLKLYGGTSAADRVLTGLVAPLVGEVRRSGKALRWFFVRHGDPEPHLRIRFAGRPEWLWSELLPAFHDSAQCWLDDGHLHRVQLDTYEREVERYGGPGGMELAEAVFEADSDAVLAALPHLIGEAGLDRRWRFAFIGVDRLLDDLGLDLEARLRLLAAARASFGAEAFGPGRRGSSGSGRGRSQTAGEDARRRLGKRLRLERPALEALRRNEVAARTPLATALSAIAARSERLLPLAAELRDKGTGGRLGTSIDDLALSFIHMHCNRVLRSAQRAHEAVLYDFLWHLDVSRRARGVAGVPGDRPAEAP